ncbi:MAG: STAS domain-containing protein [Solirubrobacterales bacterium]|nr:STAS domain-containing protein [Solirubrobacterales bacterium]
MSTLTQRPSSGAGSGRLTLDRRHDGDSVTLILRGEVDLSSAPVLDRDLHHAESLQPRRISLDLADLDFIDCTGIHLLIGAQQRADVNGHQLVLTHVPGHAQRLFSLTGLNAQLNIE